MLLSHSCVNHISTFLLIVVFHHTPFLFLWMVFSYHLEERSPYARSSKNQSGGSGHGSAVFGQGLDLSLDGVDEELAAMRAPSEAAGDRVLDMRLNPKQLKLRYPGKASELIGIESPRIKLMSLKLGIGTKRQQNPLVPLGFFSPINQFPILACIAMN